MKAKIAPLISTVLLAGCGSATSVVTDPSPPTTTHHVAHHRRAAARTTTAETTATAETTTTTVTASATTPDPTSSTDSATCPSGLLLNDTNQCVAPSLMCGPVAQCTPAPGHPSIAYIGQGGQSSPGWPACRVVHWTDGNVTTIC